MITRLCLTIAALLGVMNIANGLFMLVRPMNWYFAVPGVTGTGPFNQHFIRDIGLIFILLGAMMLAGILRPAIRPWLWSASAIWLAGHVLFHGSEVAVGICAPSALARDFPGVTLPAIVTILLAAWSLADRRRGSSPAAAA